VNKDSVNIILPSNLYFIKGNSNIFGAYGVCSPHGQAEYNLYYKNFIYPYNENLDIDMICEYGKKYNDFWQFDGVCDKECFSLELKVYSPFGELLASKTSTVHMTAGNMNSGSIICIGDSMTRAGVYVSQLCDTLPNVKTLGTRCYDGTHFCEGRGGWHTKNYFETSTGEGGTSPFLFPKYVSGEKYFGDVKFWKKALSENWEDYVCVGLQQTAKFLGMENLYDNNFPVSAKDGDVVFNDGLYKMESGEWKSFADEFEFSFPKYMQRYKAFFKQDSVDVVSILLGTNDFYAEKYEELSDKISYVIEKFEYMINSVKEYDSNIKIIINLPILLAGASFGEAPNGETTAKRCRFKILSFAEKILEKWDNVESAKKGIFVSPMLNMLDMVESFDKSYIKKNKYTNELMVVYENAVHPSRVGYKQMGDALSGVVTYVLNK